MKFRQIKGKFPRDVRGDFCSGGNGRAFSFDVKEEDKRRRSPVHHSGRPQARKQGWPIVSTLNILNGAKGHKLAIREANGFDLQPQVTTSAQAAIGLSHGDGRLRKGAR